MTNFAYINNGISHAAMAIVIHDGQVQPILVGRDGGEYPGNDFSPELAEQIGVAFIQAAHAAKQMPQHERPVIRTKATA